MSKYTVSVPEEGSNLLRVYKMGKRVVRKVPVRFLWVNILFLLSILYFVFSACKGFCQFTIYVHICHNKLSMVSRTMLYSAYWH